MPSRRVVLRHGKSRACAARIIAGVTVAPTASTAWISRSSRWLASSDETNAAAAVLDRFGVPDSPDPPGALGAECRLEEGIE